MDLRASHKRLLAAKALLAESTTTREKFTHIRHLIEGVHPKLDDLLKEVDQHIGTVEKVIGGDVIHLTAEHLPEETEEQKKRKRALLLFINTWKKLQGEVARVAAELEAGKDAQTPGEHVSVWAKVFNVIKNPFSIVTIVAVGAVVGLQAASVKIDIQNQGCGTFEVAGSMPFSIPGLSLPTEPIPNNGSATAELPGLTVEVDGTSKSALTMRFLTFTMSFGLPSSIRDVTLNGTSLLGKKSSVALSEHEEHILILSCR